MDGMLTMSRLSFRPDALGQTATFTLSCFLSCLGKSVSFGTVCLRCTAPGLRMMHGCQLQSTESLTRLSHCQIARGRDPQHVRQSRPLTDDGSQREPSPTNRSFYPLAALAALALRPPDIEGRGLRLYGPESIRFPLAAACRRLPRRQRLNRGAHRLLGIHVQPKSASRLGPQVMPMC